MNWIDEFPYDDANEKYVLSELGFDSVDQVLTKLDASDLDIPKHVLYSSIPVLTQWQFRQTLIADCNAQQLDKLIAGTKQAISDLSQFRTLGCKRFQPTKLYQHYMLDKALGENYIELVLCVSQVIGSFGWANQSKLADQLANGQVIEDEIEWDEIFHTIHMFKPFADVIDQLIETR